MGVVRFLGTNCDQDVFSAVERMQVSAQWLWYKDTFDPKGFRALIIPGGFSHGDYLRCGALAAKAPIMQDIRKAADHGVPILGICNGFQILCEAGLLPGALLRNKHLKFTDKWVDLKVSNPNPYWGGADIRLPIAHGEGRYFVEENQRANLFDNGQVWLTYADNPNGSIHDIAGVTNRQKNVAGLMPHPERAMANWMGGEDGQKILGRLWA